MDGSQYYEEGVRKDKVRDHYLTGLGFQVMRFPSTEVFGYIDAIVDEIYEQLHVKSPQPPLIPQTERDAKNAKGGEGKKREEAKKKDATVEKQTE